VDRTALDGDRFCGAGRRHGARAGRADPLVKAVLDRFPGAEIVGVRGHKDAVESQSDGDAVPPPDDEALGDNWVRDDGSN
jgi:hypothetical protein